MYIRTQPQPLEGFFDTITLPFRAAGSLVKKGLCIATSIPGVQQTAATNPYAAGASIAATAICPPGQTYVQQAPIVQPAPVSSLTPWLPVIAVGVMGLIVVLVARR